MLSGILKYTDQIRVFFTFFDWIEQPIVCTRQNLKPDYFDRRHLGETTSRTTALDLPSEDYESNRFSRKSLLLSGPSMLSMLLQTEVSQQIGLTKMAAANLLASKMKQ